MLKYDSVYDYNAWFSRAVVVMIAITTRSSMRVNFRLISIFSCFMVDFNLGLATAVTANSNSRYFIFSFTFNIYSSVA